MLLFAALALIGPAKAQPAWVEKIGDYKLVKWSSPERERETLYIEDAKRRRVVWVTDSQVGIDGEFFDKPKIRRMDINGDGSPEVVLETRMGASHTYHVWSLGRHPRCLLAYDKNTINADDLEIKDIDGDGVPEIESWYDGYAYLIGGSYWPDMPVVLRYERGRCVDRTALYPKVLKEAEKDAWKNLASREKGLVPQAWEGPAGPAINLIALGDIMGTRPRIWRQLGQKLPKATMRWLHQREPTILAIIRGRFNRYQYPKAYAKGPVDFKPFPHDQQYDAIFR